MADDEATWTPEQVAIGQRLRGARIAAGFTSVEKFAAAIGVKAPTVYRNEAGQPPSFATLKSWAEACGVSMDYLAGREDLPEASAPAAAATGTDDYRP